MSSGKCARRARCSVPKGPGEGRLGREGGARVGAPVLPPLLSLMPPCCFAAWAGETKGALPIGLPVGAGERRAWGPGGWALTKCAASWPRRRCRALRGPFDRRLRRRLLAQEAATEPNHLHPAAGTAPPPLSLPGPRWLLASSPQPQLQKGGWRGRPTGNSFFGGGGVSISMEAEAQPRPAPT